MTPKLVYLFLQFIYLRGTHATLIKFVTPSFSMQLIHNTQTSYFRSYTSKGCLRENIKQGKMLKLNCHTKHLDFMVRLILCHIILGFSYLLAFESKKHDNPMCITSNPVSDYCDLKGDIRIHGNSSTIYVVSFDNTILSGNSTWRIRPYARKGNEQVMKSIREWTIKLAGDYENAPRCTRTHDVPAVIFSLSGYAHNLFHDFTDFLIPLFTNTLKFNHKVHFLITDYRPNWISRFRLVLKRLSMYKLIDIDNENEIRCYKNVLVGLNRHKALDIDPLKSPKNVTMKDFRQFIRSTYSLTRSIAKKSIRKKPRLMIISRQKRRKWRNVNGIAETARKMGFEVIVKEANRTTNVSKFAKIVNSCDVLMGIHGAGLANMVFLPDESVVIQVIPLGALEPFAKEVFEDPTKNMKLRYLKYKIEAEESSLMERYEVDDDVIKDPLSVHKQGWEAIHATYLDKQDVTLNLTRFTPTLLKAFHLLH